MKMNDNDDIDDDIYDDIDETMTENEKKIGERIRGLRIQKGITQRTLARQVGLKPSGFSYVEMGKNQPTSRLIIEISKFFNVSTDYLLTGRLPEHKSPYTMSVQEEQLLEIYRTDPQINKALSEFVVSKRKLLKKIVESNLVMNVQGAA